MNTENLPRDPADQISDSLEDGKNSDPDVVAKFRDGSAPDDGDKPGETPPKEVRVPESWGQE